MKGYPSVHDETTTLDAVLAGKSLARFGDGEFKLAAGRRAVSQAFDAGLSTRLRDILQDSGECLVGIPTMDPTGEKFRTFWEPFFTPKIGQSNYQSFLKVDRQYYSAFVSRPDSCPYVMTGNVYDSVLNTPGYWARVQKLWEGRPVTLVRGSSKSFTAELLVEHGAGPVTEIVTTRQDSWFQRADILRRIGDAPYVLLSIGPAATALAVELCAQGRQAVDIGILGMFFKKHLRGEAMWVLREDKER